MNSSRDSRLAFYVPSLRGGGAERVTVNLLRGMARKGIPADLLLVKAEGPYLSEVPDTVRVIDLQSTRVMASVPRLMRYLQRERPAALVSAMVQANIAALLARRLAGASTKTVVVDHSTLSKASAQSSRKERLMPMLARRVYPWADGVIAVSHGVADDLAKAACIERERIRVIYNPVVRDEMFLRAQEKVDHPWVQDGEMPLIVAVGRLTRPKDFPTLIRALAVLRQTRNARLMILGEGEERAALEALVKELRLEECVALPGFVTNPYATLSRARLFVLSSQWEGLPTVLIEALALGVPVVSTDCESGPREILDNGKYGALTPVGDSSALASAMYAALENPRPPAPRTAWEGFTEEVAVDNYLGFIRGL